MSSLAEALYPHCWHGLSLSSPIVMSITVIVITYKQGFPPAAHLGHLSAPTSHRSASGTFISRQGARGRDGGRRRLTVTPGLPAGWEPSLLDLAGHRTQLKGESYIILANIPLGWVLVVLKCVTVIKMFSPSSFCVTFAERWTWLMVGLLLETFTFV